MIELIILFEFLKYLVHSFNLNNSQQSYNNQEITTLYSEKDFKKIKPLHLEENKIKAKAILIKELEGSIIYKKNSDQVFPIASLTKLLSALTAFSLYNEKEEFVVENKLKIQENQTDFEVGEKFPRNDLIKASLVASSNAAVHLLSAKIGEKEFVNYINNLIKTIGMKNTTIEEPTGLSPNNKSTLEDLYLLAKYILKNQPVIFEFSKSPVVILKDKKMRYLYNTNKLVEKYQNIIFGTKTGYTPQAGQNLIMLVKFEKSPIIFLGLLNSSNREEDAQYLLKILNEYYQNN